MTINRLTEDAEIINNLISTIGCMTTEQVLEILNNCDLAITHKPRYNPMMPIYFLKNNRYIVEQKGGALTSVNSSISKVSPERIDCIWVLLDLIGKEKDGKITYMAEDLEQVLPSLMTCEFSFIVDNDIICHILELNPTSVSRLIPIQQQFYATTGVEIGKEKSMKIMYMIATRDKKTAENVKNFNLNIRTKVAFLTYENPLNCNSKPQIEYI